MADPSVKMWIVFSILNLRRGTRTQAAGHTARSPAAPAWRLVTARSAGHFKLWNLRHVHGNDTAEWSLPALGGRPEYRVPRLSLGERTA